MVANVTYCSELTFQTSYLEFCHTSVHKEFPPFFWASLLYRLLPSFHYNKHHCNKYPYKYLILHRRMHYNKFLEVEVLGLFKLPCNKIVPIYFLLQHFPVPVTQSQLNTVYCQTFWPEKQTRYLITSLICIFLQL